MYLLVYLTEFSFILSVISSSIFILTVGSSWIVESFISSRYLSFRLLSFFPASECVSLFVFYYRSVLTGYNSRSHLELAGIAHSPLLHHPGLLYYPSLDLPLRVRPFIECGASRRRGRGAEIAEVTRSGTTHGERNTTTMKKNEPCITVVINRTHTLRNCQ